MKKKLLILIGFFLSMFLIGGAILVYTFLDDQTTLSNQSINEYDNLFSETGREKLKILATMNSRNRPPVSTYLYNNKFNLCVFSVILANQNTLNNLVEYKQEFSNQKMNAVYSGLPALNFDMKIKDGRSTKVKTVYLKSSKGKIELTKNTKTALGYYFQFNTFSISYNDEPYDIIAKALNYDAPVSINLMFLKKNDKLYVIILSEAINGDRLDKDQLSQIVNSDFK